MIAPRVRRNLASLRRCPSPGRPASDELALVKCAGSAEVASARTGKVRRPVQSGTFHSAQPRKTPPERGLVRVAGLGCHPQVMRLNSSRHSSARVEHAAAPHMQHSCPSPATPQRDLAVHGLVHSMLEVAPGMVRCDRRGVFGLIARTRLSWDSASIGAPGGMSWSASGSPVCCISATYRGKIMAYK